MSADEGLDIDFWIDKSAEKAWRRSRVAREAGGEPKARRQARPWAMFKRPSVWERQPRGMILLQNLFDAFTTK